MDNLIDDLNDTIGGWRFEMLYGGIIKFTNITQ
jgi:hypothetical protein